MVAKTYEALSDAFDYEIRANNYVNIAKENAETFWNYKHNYIVEKLESKDRDINVWEDLKEIEEILIKEDELLWKIPFSVIEKIVNYNYWDISENESELISYLQDNTVNDAPKNVLNFIYKQEQFFDNILKQYKDIENWIIPDIEKEEPIEISMLTFRDMVRQIIFSISTGNESNKVMSGVDCIIYGDYMRLTTLDGHRVSIRNVDFDKEYKKQ